MEKAENKLLGTVLVVVVIAAIAYLFLFFSGQGTKATPEFANCLTDKGIVMYGTDWCHYCQDQKEMFGTHFGKINYVNCEYDKAACTAAGVRGYPTWAIGGVNYPGVQQLEKLAELSGCELKGD